MSKFFLTFSLYLEINRYDDAGNIVEEPAGYMLSDGLLDLEGKRYVHSQTDPDGGFASVQITGAHYAIDRDSVETRLCQACLDSINSLRFLEQPPAEYAVVSFSERTVRPLLRNVTWFSAGNYGIDCDFREDGAIHLLIQYAPDSDP